MEPLSFEEYKESSARKELSAEIHKNDALKLVNAGYLPKRFFWAYRFWSLVWVGLIIAGPIVGVMYHWLACLGIWFSAWTLFGAIKTSLCEFVIEHSLADEHFYYFVVANGLLRVSRK